MNSLEHHESWLVDEKLSPFLFIDVLEQAVLKSFSMSNEGCAPSEGVSMFSRLLGFSVWIVLCFGSFWGGLFVLPLVFYPCIYFSGRDSSNGLPQPCFGRSCLSLPWPQAPAETIQAGPPKWAPSKGIITISTIHLHYVKHFVYFNSFNLQKNLSKWIIIISILNIWFREVKQFVQCYKPLETNDSASNFYTPAAIPCHFSSCSYDLMGAQTLPWGHPQLLSTQA